MFTCTFAVAATLMVVPPLTDGYLDHAGLTERVRALESDRACSVRVIGSSGEGRDLFALTLSSDPARAAERPALLVTAGLDGQHLVGTEIAVRLAERLVRDHRDALGQYTVYVLPRMNPDAAESNLATGGGTQTGTFRPVDDDHDGQADEDAPFDLDGDGFITRMRRAQPPLDDDATHLADPGEPRLLKTPNRLEGEVAIYAVYPEGLDRDGDGEIAEDGRGSVVLDRNFMHEWPEHAVDAGPYQLSESESAALAAFVLAHPEIVAAITLGPHDTVVKPPDGKGKDVSGEGPKTIHADDVPLFKEVSKLYRDTTGQKRAASASHDGAFHIWLYAQRGVPSFAVRGWGRPDEEGDEKRDEGDEPGKGDDAATPNADASAADAPPADQSEREVADEDESLTEDGDAEEPEKKEPKAEPADKEDAAWLVYSDESRDGAGFRPWTPFDHPTLGPVEIGGFVPGFKMNPPADTLDTLADVQTSFAVALMAWRPQLAWAPPEVESLGGGLLRIRFGLVNEGRLPTSTTMSRRTRALPPTVVRLSTPLERIVAGDRVHRVWGIDGSGAREVLTWIIRTEPGESTTIEIVDPRQGTHRVDVTP